MESPRKFNDCYFYYYSTCTKGDKCVFRHEPAALGCETMCATWQQGQCLDAACTLRHMELRKNRKQIPCYWESQPGGCRKRHCPFMHKNPDARTDGIAPSQPGPPQHPVLSASVEQSPAVPQPIPQPMPQPMPLLWQQHPRQVAVGLGAEAGRVLAPPPRLEPPPPPHGGPHGGPMPHGGPHLNHLLIKFEEGMRLY